MFGSGIHDFLSFACVFLIFSPPTSNTRLAEMYFFGRCIRIAVKKHEPVANNDIYYDQMNLTYLSDRWNRYLWWI